LSQDDLRGERRVKKPDCQVGFYRPDLGGPLPDFEAEVAAANPSALKLLLGS